MEVSSEFEEDYQDRLDDVLRSEHHNFAQRNADWIKLLEQSPESSELIQQLERDADFEAWFQEANNTIGGMVGSGRLDWSSDPRIRLGQYLGLVRYFGSNENAGVNFAMGFMYAGSNLNDNISKIIDQVIEPFGRDLWKYIVRSARARGNRELAPASDGLVPLDHNSAPYQDLIFKLDAVEREARSTNSIATEEEFERIEAEVSAGKRLLQATSARVEAIKAVLMPALKWLGARAGDTTLGILITAVIALVATMFGFTIPGM